MCSVKYLASSNIIFEFVICTPQLCPIDVCYATLNSFLKPSKDCGAGGQSTCLNNTSSGMLRRVVLSRTDVSKGRIASIVRVRIIVDQETKQ
jgi:hypothetical protein